MARRYPRVRVRLPALWSSRTGVNRTAEICDVSVNGLLLHIDASSDPTLQPGAWIGVHFSIPGGPAVTVRGEVRWRTKNETHGGHGIGIEFDVLSPEISRYFEPGLGLANRHGQRMPADF